MSLHSARGNHRLDCTYWDSRPNDRADALVVNAPSLNLQPMSELNLKIANGWGDTPQTKLPPDWRTRKKPERGKSDRKRA